jgi:hypothetical protein
MRRARFSIRGLMMAIVLMAAAFAALRTPSRLWANAWFSMALAGITLAVPAALCARDGDRAFWCGFAACGWVYFLVSLGPWVHRETSFQLFTTTVLDIAAPHIVENEYLLRSYMAGFNPPKAPQSPTPWQVWNLPDFTEGETWHLGYATLHCPGLYLRIGHAAFTLLLAFLGGEASRYLHSTRPEREAPNR